MKIKCPKHGEIESNAIGEEQAARYSDYAKQVKAKNPEWKPLSAVIQMPKRKFLCPDCGHVHGNER